MSDTIIKQLQDSIVEAQEKVTKNEKEMNDFRQKIMQENEKLRAEIKKKNALINVLKACDGDDNFANEIILSVGAISKKNDKTQQDSDQLPDNIVE